jgi:hypothetical protein
MLVTCRHDIPLRLYNIRGTGERLSYAHILLQDIMASPDCPHQVVCQNFVLSLTLRSFCMTFPATLNPISNCACHATSFHDYALLSASSICMATNSDARSVIPPDGYMASL